MQAEDHISIIRQNKILNKEQHKIYCLDGTPATSIVHVFCYSGLNRGQNNSGHPSKKLTVGMSKGS
jgi:hypothetical protein